MLSLSQSKYSSNLYVGFIAVAFAVGISQVVIAGEPRIDADFPGGNIVVEGLSDDAFTIHQDQRDTRDPWFYWYFRVRGAEGRRLTVHFSQGNVIGPRGPAFSRDSGQTWHWLEQGERSDSFIFAFAPDDLEVRFCFGTPYLESHLKDFLTARADHPHLAAEVLCQTKKARPVERLRVGRLQGDAPLRVLLTARHHACEMSANYVLEGTIDAILAETQEGAWLREQVEFWIVPFVDKDGVEDGDQGKLRQPHDPWLDYAGESIFPATAALRQQVPDWSRGRLRVALDLHSPSRLDERIYLAAGSTEQEPELKIFSQLLADRHQGAFVFDPRDNLSFGAGWNTQRTYGPLRSFSQWAETIPGVRLAATLEFPYAQVQGRAVTPERARQFGRELAHAIQEYLAQSAP